MVVYSDWKIDDNDIVVNKKKSLGCNKCFPILKIIK